MTINRIEEISTAKRVDDQASILGYNHGGALLKRDGKLFGLKHNIHRHNGTGTWGRKDGGYTSGDLMEIGFQISPFPTSETTKKLADDSLAEIKKGQIPGWLTTGIEVEGAVYDSSGTNLISIYDDCGVDVTQYPHPELLAFTLETASSPTSNEEYPRTPTEIALSLAGALLRGHAIADNGNGLLAYSSVPESGNYRQAKITPHPYLLSFAPKVLQSTLDHAHLIPLEVIELYQLAGIDILPHLKNDQILNWPAHALHVHNGVPMVDQLADPKTALAMGLLRLTEFAKVMSFMLSNTRHLYGVDTNHRDVRAILRRLLPTSHDATIPLKADQYFAQAVGSLIQGRIHSLPRFPARGQHDRLRLRVDADKKTVESIDAAMNPDVRIQLAWIYFNQVLSMVALDALAQPQVAGDESKVIPYLEGRFGSLFSLIPTLGPGSSYKQDFLFDQSGYNATMKQLGGKSFAQLLGEAVVFLEKFSKKYPAIKIQSDIVIDMIRKQLANDYEPNLVEYFGIKSGNYNPNGRNVGILTDHKIASPSDIIYVEAKGNRLQAESLNQIRDENDLYSFFGIKK